MTELPVGPVPTYRYEDEISVFAIASVILRWRWHIVAFAVLGVGLGLMNGLSKPRLFMSSATFIPKSSQEGASGIALAASQFGFNFPSASGGWGPAMYVQLIQSRALLEPIVFDTVDVPEEGKRRIALMDLLQIKAPTREQAVTTAVGTLNGMIAANEEKKLGGVTVTVKTRWPSVSLALTNRLVQRVNQFNLETRKSQAAVERQFVETQALESERALREAEDNLQAFLQSNRDISGSPGLAFGRDRLQREVTRRNQLYTSWLQSREEARIREIRDTPVITVFENPRLAFKGEPRRSALKGILGGLAGALLGVLFALLADALAGARRSKREDAREFFQMIENVTPRVLKRRAR
ncbi:Wzz/FepE/Etk N-terminal domain-containing protein [soil metagenome]